MRRNKRSFLFVLLAIILAVDLYAFKALHLLCKNSFFNICDGIYVIYGGLTGFFIIAILMAFQIKLRKPDFRMFNRYFLLAGLFLLIYLPKFLFISFHLLEDLIYSGAKVLNHLPFIQSYIAGGESIHRNLFLSRLGGLLALIPFGFILYGMIRGRFQFQVVHQPLIFDNLPKSFDGLKIVQISDLHAGGFYTNQNKLREVVQLINTQNPDIVVFTGDLVNGFAHELNGLEYILNRIHANIGKYSILGNHDYGKYFSWNTELERKSNFRQIKRFHAKMGFRLLMNEGIRLYKDQEEIALLGVENWGYYHPFHKYGDLQQAEQHVKDIPFKLLLSHDPSHWDAKVLGQKDIALTLSGHTHGMQCGWRNSAFRCSPAKFRYPRWGGLYYQKGQWLYVNVGLGHIGFPGRIGMRPEITVLHLQAGDQKSK